MRKMRKRREDCQDAKLPEPLAEGIAEKRSRRSPGLIASLSDAELSAMAKRLIEEKGMKRRSEFQRVDSILYSEMRRRGLLDEVGLPSAVRQWRTDRMDDDELLRFANRYVEENGIRNKKELQSHARGLAQALTNRGLLDRVDFEETKADWASKSDEELIGTVQREMMGRHILSRSALCMEMRGAYAALKSRGLLDQIEFRKERRTMSDKSDEEVLVLARNLIKREKIGTQTALKRSDSLLFSTLRRRGLLDRLSYERTKAPLSRRSDEELVGLAQGIIKERGITKRSQLARSNMTLYNYLANRGLLDRVFGLPLSRWPVRRLIRYAEGYIAEKGIGCREELLKTHNALYSALRKRGLMDKVLESKRRMRNWKGMSDEELEGFASEFIERHRITRRIQLERKDPGLNMVLIRRGLIDGLFSGLESSLEKDEVRQVFDALSEF